MLRAKQWADMGPVATTKQRCLPMRRFPPPWTVEVLDGCSLSGFKVIDANRQSLAYVYGHAEQRDAQIANAQTLDEARCIATSPSCPT